MLPPNAKETRPAFIVPGTRVEWDYNKRIEAITQRLPADLPYAEYAGITYHPDIRQETDGSITFLGKKLQFALLEGAEGFRPFAYARHKTFPSLLPGENAVELVLGVMKSADDPQNPTVVTPQAVLFEVNSEAKVTSKTIRHQRSIYARTAAKDSAVYIASTKKPNVIHPLINDGPIPGYGILTDPIIAVRSDQSLVFIDPHSLARHDQLNTANIRMGQPAR